MAIPTMTLPTNTGMDFENLFRNNSNNYNEVRSQISSPNKQSSRASLISLTVSLVIYYKRIEMNNNLEDDIEIEPIEST